MSPTCRQVIGVPVAAQSQQNGLEQHSNSRAHVLRPGGAAAGADAPRTEVNDQRQPRVKSADAVQLRRIQGSRVDSVALGEVGLSEVGVSEVSRMVGQESIVEAEVDGRGSSPVTVGEVHATEVTVADLRSAEVRGPEADTRRELADAVEVLWRHDRDSGQLVNRFDDSPLVR